MPTDARNGEDCEAATLTATPTLNAEGSDEDDELVVVALEEVRAEEADSEEAEPAEPEEASPDAPEAALLALPEAPLPEDPELLLEPLLPEVEPDEPEVEPLLPDAPLLPDEDEPDEDEPDEDDTDEDDPDEDEPDEDEPDDETAEADAEDAPVEAEVADAEIADAAVEPAPAPPIVKVAAATVLTPAPTDTALVAAPSPRLALTIEPAPKLTVTPSPVDAAVTPAEADTRPKADAPADKAMLLATPTLAVAVAMPLAEIPAPILRPEDAAPTESVTEAREATPAPAAMPEDPAATPTVASDATCTPNDNPFVEAAVMAIGAFVIPAPPRLMPMLANAPPVEVAATAPPPVVDEGTLLPTLLRVARALAAIKDVSDDKV